LGAFFVGMLDSKGFEAATALLRGENAAVQPRRRKLRIIRGSTQCALSFTALLLLSAKSHAPLACSVASALAADCCRYQLFAVPFYTERKQACRCEPKNKESCRAAGITAKHPCG